MPLSFHFSLVNRNDTLGGLLCSSHLLRFCFYLIIFQRALQDRTRFILSAYFVPCRYPQPGEGEVMQKPPFKP